MLQIECDVREDTKPDDSFSGDPTCMTNTQRNLASYRVIVDRPVRSPTIVH